MFYYYYKYSFSSNALYDSRPIFYFHAIGSNLYAIQFSGSTWNRESSLM